LALLELKVLLALKDLKVFRVIREKLDRKVLLALKDLKVLKF
jgi:hypothetical protein